MAQILYYPLRNLLLLFFYPKGVNLFYFFLKKREVQYEKKVLPPVCDSNADGVLDTNIEERNFYNGNFYSDIIIGNNHF